MINRLKIGFIVTGVLIVTTAWSEGGASWHCAARDAANKEWTANSGFSRSAINHAFEACKKESTLPDTCKTSSVDCESFIDGVSTRPAWRCLALDQMGKSWKSNPYPQRDDAAIAAKAYCQDQSGFPDTCYINLMTCKNLNSRS